MYGFSVGDRVRIHATKTSSIGVKQHDGEVVTIGKLCPFTWAYELVELDGLWQDSCFKEATT